MTLTWRRKLSLFANLRTGLKPVYWRFNDIMDFLWIFWTSIFKYLFICISILVQFRSFWGWTNISLSVMLVVLLWLWWCKSNVCWITCVLFVYTAVCASQAELFFSWEGKCLCLAMCHDKKLRNFCLPTDVISVRLEWKLWYPRFGHYYVIGLCDSCSRHLLIQFVTKRLFLLFYVKYKCDRCSTLIFDWNKNISQNPSRNKQLSSSFRCAE